MQTIIRFLVLVPHRDARLPLRAWSDSLFAAGLPGAWSFPWVAPLAQIKRPLSSDELKCLARTLRQHINSEGGKLIAGPPSVCAFPAGLLGGEPVSVFGPVLQNELPHCIYECIYNAIAHPLSPLILGSALVRGDALPGNLPPPPHTVFRAAALANMSYQPLPAGEGGYSFEWEIGDLHWLPRQKP